MACEPMTTFPRLSSTVRRLRTACLAHPNQELQIPIPCADEPLMVSIPLTDTSDFYVFLIELGMSWVYFGFDTNNGKIRYLVDHCYSGSIEISKEDADVSVGVSLANFVYALLNNGGDLTIRDLLLREKDSQDKSTLRRKGYGLDLVRLNWLGPIDYRASLEDAMNFHVRELEMGVDAGQGEHDAV